jgi:hypothetical protein
LVVKPNRLPVKLMATLWLLTYVICIGLVFSFILFEVLDIDGSDFPASTSNLATAIKLAEPPHEIKRALLTASAQLWALLPIALVLLAAADLSRRGTPRRVSPQIRPPGRRGLRVALPRASLADAVPSA